MGILGDVPSPGIDHDLILAGIDKQAGVGRVDMCRGQAALVKRGVNLFDGRVRKEHFEGIIQSPIIHGNTFERSDLKLVKFFLQGLPPKAHPAIIYYSSDLLMLALIIRL